MVNTLIQSFGGNVGIGTKSTTYALDVYTGTSSFESLSTTEISVGGIPHAHIPSGMIAMWSGAIDSESIPQGWSLCDGSGTTPDLRERFILGYGTTFSTVGASGGSFQKTITASILANHTHTLATISSDGDHAHGGSSSAGAHSHNQGTLQGSHNHSWNPNSESHTHNTITPASNHNHTNNTQAGSHSHANYIIDTRYNNNSGQAITTGGNASWWAVTNVKSYSVANRQTIQGGDHNHAMPGSHSHQHSSHQHSHTTGGFSHTHNVAAGGGHTHTTGAGGSHEHTSTTGTTGSPTAVTVDLKPQYYVLAYIIKD